jgi:hypothetical protein
MKVWIAIIHHEYGTDPLVAASKRALTALLYEYAQEWWEHEFNEKMPKRMGKAAAVTAYFERMSDRGGEEYADIFDAVEVPQ